MLTRPERRSSRHLTFRAKANQKESLGRLSLLFENDRSTVVVAVQIEIDAVMHEVTAAYGLHLLHLAGINRFDFVEGILVKTAQEN